MYSPDFWCVSRVSVCFKLILDVYIDLIRVVCHVFLFSYSAGQVYFCFYLSDFSRVCVCIKLILDVVAHLCLFSTEFKSFLCLYSSVFRYLSRVCFGLISDVFHVPCLHLTYFKCVRNALMLHWLLEVISVIFSNLCL